MVDDAACKAIQFDCPHCHSRLRAALSVAGRHLDCPWCDTPLLVPAAVNQSGTVADAPTVPNTPALPS